MNRERIPSILGFNLLNEASILGCNGSQTHSRQYLQFLNVQAVSPFSGCLKFDNLFTLQNTDLTCLSRKKQKYLSSYKPLTHSNRSKHLNRYSLTSKIYMVYIELCNVACLVYYIRCVMMRHRSRTIL